MSNIQIKESTPEEIYDVHYSIPEFHENEIYSLEKIQKELEGEKSLTLLGYIGDKPAGYIIGLDKFRDGSFYSWIGATLPEYRGQGIYKELREYQEEWAKKEGFRSVKVKTWNKRIPMRIILAKMGYNIVAFEEKEDVLENRLMHEKSLT